MKTILKILKWILLIAIIGGVIFYSFVHFTWEKKWEAPYPDIVASTDSALIARGKYLAYGPAHCGTCHVPMDKIMAVENGEIIPLSGGWEMSIPPGTFRAPNLTPDIETGIGNLSDGDLARTLRNSIGSDGRCIFPFMPFQDISDEDLKAIISFIRSQPPVRHEVKKTEYTFLGKMIMAIGMMKPEGPKNSVLKKISIDTTAEYGKYLANSVANCVGCHTKRDLKTGAFIGEPFAGGFIFYPEPLSNGYGFVSPNITPDTQTGIMATWDEETFLSRFRKNRLHEGTPMPWGSFSRINDLEVRAIYRYLRTLEPVHNKIEKIVYSPGEAMPEL